MYSPATIYSNQIVKPVRIKTSSFHPDLQHLVPQLYRQQRWAMLPGLLRLFGWWNQPRMVLTWNDVKCHCFTWRQMRALGISADAPKEVQPCKTEWIQRGGIQIEDLHDMTTFPVNPIIDFGCDLAELWKMKLSHDSMKKRERLVFIGTCSVTTTLVSAFTKSDNRTKVKFSFDLLEPHIGSLLLAFLCLT